MFFYFLLAKFFGPLSSVICNIPASIKLAKSTFFDGPKGNNMLLKSNEGEVQAEKSGIARIKAQRTASAGVFRIEVAGDIKIGGGGRLAKRGERGGGVNRQ